MRVSHLTLKQLTILVSLVMSLMFVISYVTIHYFWNYDKALEQARLQQAEEVNRINTVLNLTKHDLANTLEDYAAWNDVADYIAKPDPTFIEDSLSDHTFISLKLNGIFIFDTAGKLVWGRYYDYISDKTLPYDEIRYKFGSLLATTFRSPIEQITTDTKLLVINGKPALMSASRVCNSDGEECDKGYMLLIKPINERFSQTLKQATGLDVHIATKAGTELNDSSFQANTSIIEKQDYQNHSTVYIIVHHAAKLPTFLSFGQLGAILAFAGFTFIANLYLAHLILQPFKAARTTLNGLVNGNTHSKPLASRFISQEMQDFAQHVNRIFSELDTQRKELEWMSYHDTLTKVANRRKLQLHWDEIVSHDTNKYISIALVDIDYFKSFNDNYGHLEGDEALKMVASALSHSKTECNKFVARFGGEEFCIILSSAQPINNAEEAHFLLDSIKQLAIPHEYTKTDVDYLTVSIGTFNCQQCNLPSLKEALLIADEALYQAKENGRNGYVLKV